MELELVSSPKAAEAWPTPGRGSAAAVAGAAPQAMNDGVDLDRLAFTVVAFFRSHPHISNILTHISGANWSKVELSVRAILAPRAKASELSALDRNLIELLWAERGITGRILKPYFEQLIEAMLGRNEAGALLAHLDLLLRELDGDGSRYPADRAGLHTIPLGDQASRPASAGQRSVSCPATIGRTPQNASASNL